MVIDDLTIGEAKELSRMFGGGCDRKVENGMVGMYVIVRCHDAGVHAGVLVDYSGRECVLNEARRLWYWKPANKASNLSGVAVEGLDPSSKIGAPVHIHLTENCEIIQCTEKASESIRGLKSHEQ